MAFWKPTKTKKRKPRPLDTEIEATQKQWQKSQAALQRNFTAFEAGTMDPATCIERVAELATQIRQLDEKLLDLNREREELDLPALQTDFIREILTNLHGVVEAIPVAQKKHLLQLLVEKVLIEDKRTFKVWYRLPQFPGGVRTLSHLVAPRLQYANNTRTLRNCRSYHPVFRLSAASLHPEKAPRSNSGFQVRLTGLA